MPPDFCAKAGAATSPTANKAAKPASGRRLFVIGLSIVAYPVGITAPTLFVEPSVLETPAVVVAVDHHRVPFEIGLPASRRFRIEERRARGVFRELALDFPDDLL